MDHKISKDMISSGMIPSGEKTQADLGRTQYGSAPSPSSLMDAYKKIYEHHQKDADGKVIEHEVEETTPSSVEESKKDPDVLSQDVDLFDLIKGRLLDEGSDEEEALKIMANISQEDFDKLKEDITLTKGDYASRNTSGSAYSTAKSKGFKGYKAGGGLGSDFLPRV